MRHRAHRSILDRLRPLARTRGALATAALLLAGLATGTALTAGEPAEDAPAAGQAKPTDPGAPYDPATPTVTGSTGPDRSPKPSDETTPSASASLRPTQSPVSRSGGRGTSEPTPLETPSPDTPGAAPTQAPTSEEPAADAPETTATTRSANASRWVIGVGSDAEATYECSLDGGAYQPCGTTVTYDDLDRGTHSFAARAIDGDGDTDPSPATLTAEIGPRGQG
jgi:hypothetical protein